jgi:hypothetical protein
MQVLLVVEPSPEGTGIGAMIWTRTDADPRLLESKQFKGAAALQVWLAGIATRYGASSIVVSWTDSLKNDERLSEVVRKTIDPGLPSG